jgi:hypothetical protein
VAEQAWAHVMAALAPAAVAARAATGIDAPGTDNALLSLFFHDYMHHGPKFRFASWRLCLSIAFLLGSLFGLFRLCFVFNILRVDLFFRAPKMYSCFRTLTRSLAQPVSCCAVRPDAANRCSRRVSLCTRARLCRLRMRLLRLLLIPRCPPR